MLKTFFGFPVVLDEKIPDDEFIIKLERYVISFAMSESKAQEYQEMVLKYMKEQESGTDVY